MTIKSKFPGRCTKCGQHFPAGTSVNWERGKGASHATSSECVEPPPAPTVEINLKTIAEFIQAARDRGLKFPKLRVLAPDGKSELRLGLTSQGANPGSVTVKLNGEYLGMVLPSGLVKGALASMSELQYHLIGVALMPAAAAKAYSALTCRCSFC